MPGQHASSLQLIALSEHNEHLTGDPDLSKFTVFSEEPDASVLRLKHTINTNYALDNERIDLDGNNFLGQRTVTEIKKQADLLRSLYVCVDLPGIWDKRSDAEKDAEKVKLKDALKADLLAQPDNQLDDGQAEAQATAEAAEYVDGLVPYYKDRLGYKMIERIELKIGNQVIQCLDGDYLELYDALQGDAYTKRQLVFNYSSVGQRRVASNHAQRLYVPIPFFFSSSTYNALPLAGIPYHKVCIEMVLKPLPDLIEHYDNAGIYQKIDLIGQSRKGKSTAADARTGAAAVVPTNRDTNVFLECGFVYLDEAEHKHVGQADNSFLIMQTQRLSKSLLNGKKQEIRLPFNHPIRELVWTVKDTAGPAESSLMIPDPVTSVMLRLNNHPRFNMNGGRPVEGRYFRTVQALEAHGELPEDSDNQFYYCYSFDMTPESPDPGGSLNCSRVDHAVMEFEFEEEYTAGELVLFARNWNVVHIKDQKISLAYAS